jgi:pimeloyl-ACP methyl ester carboxylesterase
MKRYDRISLLALAVFTAIPQYAKEVSPASLAGVTCQLQPPLHCPDANCPGPMVIEQGTATEPKTGRKFFLDFPCDLKRGEKVTFILSLHGAGSYGNWQRHYFPIMDHAKKYRLVIATPNTPTRVWSPMDDEYLRNIVTLVYDQLGKQNIRAFWLVGHSQGGMTSNRLVGTEFFKERVTGWLSLSGGRLGPTPPIPASFFSASRPGNPGAAGLAAAMEPLRDPPDATFSFIFETGQHELGDQPIPDASPWATKLGCRARVRRPDVTDTKAGYVYDSTRQDPGSDAWERLPRPGAAEIFEYPHCKDGRVVADVVRMGKGHTEGLEPHVTEQLVRMMLSAKQ